MPPTHQQNDTWRNRTHPIKEDMRFQRATWRVERIGWILLWLIMILALLGLFSEGPLSTTSVESPAGDLRVTYGRFQRSGAPAEVKLEASPKNGQEVVIRVSATMLDAFAIESISPRPQTERGVTHGVELVFPVAAGELLTVYMTVRPDGVGLVSSEIGIGPGRPAQLNQFIYP
jgi:hypothetical protein